MSVSESWSEWGPWSGCSRTCGDQGTRERTRICLVGGREAPEEECNPVRGDLKDIKSCPLPQCLGDLLTFSKSQKFVNNDFNSECQDVLNYIQFCPRWKAQFGCSFVPRPKWSSSISKLCPRTCGLCPTTLSRYHHRYRHRGAGGAVKYPWVGK